MGDFIKWFEKHFYKDNIVRGGILTFSLLLAIFIITYTIVSVTDNIFILSILGSMGLATKSLYDSVNNVINNPDSIKYLVSRDTDNLSQSDINKAAIETYGENISDGIIAPLFYLIFFGIIGLFLYKGVNTLDSMVGYRNSKYENFGKISAKLDDILNYIPSRLTAIFIAVVFLNIKILKKVFSYGKLHESPNAGYPISALGLILKVKLGGDTSYFGKIKYKPYFSEGKKDIVQKDIKKALSFQRRFDILFYTILITLVGITLH